MSTNINKAAVKFFDSMPKRAYEQNGFKLKGSTRSTSNVIGRTVQWNVYGKAMARQKAPQDDITPMNVDISQVTATLEDWYVADYTSEFEKSDINFSEMQYLAEVLASSIGRRSDQQIIDALAASATTNTIANGGTGFTYTKFLELDYFMVKNNVKNTGTPLHIFIDAVAQQDLMAEDHFVKNNYTNQQLLDRSKGSIDGLEMFGYIWHVFGDMTEGGVPISGSTHSAYAWAQNSIGHAVGMDFSTAVNDIPVKMCQLVACKYKAVAKAIDPVGIVQIDYV